MTEGRVSIDGGTRWILISPGRAEALVRLDATGSTRFAVNESLPIDGFRGHQQHDLFLPTSPDGAVWLRLQGENDACDGIGRFDGTTLSRFLRDTCVYTWDVDPDGAVWLIAGHDGGLRGGTMGPEGLIEGPFFTYVITPEAVVTSE